jgi:hypothetical protein
MLLAKKSGNKLMTTTERVAGSPSLGKLNNFKLTKSLNKRFF